MSYQLTHSLTAHRSLLTFESQKPHFSQNQGEVGHPWDSYFLVNFWGNKKAALAAA
jgi:hypothetical protein